MAKREIKMPTIEEAVELLKSGDPIPQIPHVEGVPGNQLYWILVHLVQIGGVESMEVLTGQMGLEENSKLRQLIDTYASLIPKCPIRYRRNGANTRDFIVEIQPNRIFEVKNALLKISPEHMIPEKLYYMQENEQVKSIDTKTICDAFQEQLSQSSPSYMPLHQYFKGIFRATEGLNNVRKLDNTPIVAVNIPQRLLVVSAITGPRAVGYFAEEHQVLKVRYEAQKFGEGDMVHGVGIPILIAPGFTAEARRAALFDPVVCLIPLWAMIKLLGYLQEVKKGPANARIFPELYELSRDSVAYDGHVGKVIETHLNQHSAGLSKGGTHD